jgi:hypothetical protein
VNPGGFTAGHRRRWNEGEMIKTRSRVVVGVTCLLTYLLASVSGMLLYAAFRGRWDVLLFLPLIPMLFPHGLAIVAGCYDVHPGPLQYAVAFGPYAIVAGLGIWTKRTVLFLIFIGILLVNIGGCVWTGVEDRERDKKHSNKPPHHTAESRAGARLPAAGER